MLLLSFTPAFHTFWVFFAYFLTQSAAFGWFKLISLLIGMFGSVLMIFVSSVRLIRPWLMQATDSLSTDSFQMLLSSIAWIEITCAPATIRAYFADFAAFIAFCDLYTIKPLCQLMQRWLPILFVTLLASADHRLVFDGQWWQFRSSIF